METRYPRASWRPLGVQSEPLIGVPRILIFHTMVGGLKGSDALFRREGYTGTESHFGVGGPWDGPDLDGAVWQWQDIDRQADAQGAGNAYATSIETADGGDPNRPWSLKQIQALVTLATWWCRQTGAKPRLVDSVLEQGFGYHSQFKAWNPNAHTCPNPARILQLRTVVIPAVASALAPPHVTPPRLPQQPVKVEPASTGLHGVLTRYLRNTGGPFLHGADVRIVQHALGVTGKALDGVYGPLTALAVKAFQRRRKLTPDGIVGPATAKALGLGWRGPGGVRA